MAISDAVKTEVRSVVQERLDALAKPEKWPLPALATDVDIDVDAYLAVHKYTDVVDPSAEGEPTRRMLGADLVPLQRVIRSEVLTKPELDQLRARGKAKGPEWPSSTRGRLSDLATQARLTQLEDALEVLAPEVGDPVTLTPEHLRHAIEGMASEGRVVLVTVRRPGKAICKVIEDHDEVLDHYPLHESLEAVRPEVLTMTAFLVGGTPPLAMRYLAHDLQVAVEEDDPEGQAGLRVKIEERRGWRLTSETCAVRFAPAPSEPTGASSSGGGSARQSG